MAKLRSPEQQDQDDEHEQAGTGIIAPANGRIAPGGQAAKEQQHQNDEQDGSHGRDATECNGVVAN